MTLVSTDESKDAPIKYQKLGNKDLIRSNTNKSDNYDKKYMKRKFNLNDDLPLKERKENLI